MRGDWYPAEATLRKLLRADAQDADGRLMLATLLRHTERSDDARRELKRVEQLESAEKWQLEIQQEYERLAATAANVEDDSSDADEDVDVVMVDADETRPSAGASEAA